MLKEEVYELVTKLAAAFGFVRSPDRLLEMSSDHNLKIKTKRDRPHRSLRTNCRLQTRVLR
jgi:hypothetical protein